MECKQHVARNNTEFTMESMRALVQQRMNEFDVEWWTNACNHAYNFACDFATADEELLAINEQPPPIDDNNGLLEQDDQEIDNDLDFDDEMDA